MFELPWDSLCDFFSFKYVTFLFLRVPCFLFRENWAFKCHNVISLKTRILLLQELFVFCFDC